MRLSKVSGLPASALVYWTVRGSTTSCKPWLSLIWFWLTMLYSKIKQKAWQQTKVHFHWLADVFTKSPKQVFYKITKFKMLNIFITIFRCYASCSRIYIVTCTHLYCKSTKLNTFTTNLQNYTTSGVLKKLPLYPSSSMYIKHVNKI